MSEKEDDWTRYLDRITKAISTKTLALLDEKSYDDVLDEWEQGANGSGVPLYILKHLALQLGSPTVTFRHERVDQHLEWVEFRHELARLLFPHSEYVCDVELAMDREDRSRPFSESLVELLRMRKRHRMLCVR